MVKKINKHQLADILEILFLAAILAGIFEIKYYNRFYPNVFIGEEEVGGKSYAEVLETFKQRENSLRENGFDLVFFRNGASKTVAVPAESYGLTADTVVEYFSLGEAEQTVGEAFRFGRRGSIFRRIGEQAYLIFGQRRFAFPNSIQAESIRSLLDRELNTFYENPVPARFSVKKGAAGIVKEKVGERIDNEGDKIIRLLENSLVMLKTNALFFSPKPHSPAVTEEKLQPFLPIVSEIAEKMKVKFSYWDYEWNVSGGVLASWLTLDEPGNLVVDRGKLEAFLAKTAKPLIDNPPQNSRFAIQNGQLAEIFRGQPGNSLDVKKIEAILNDEIAAGDFMDKKELVRIRMPIVKEEPKITKETIDNYGIKELVAKVKTSFKGSTDGRKHNIRTGLARLNGVLIAPEEEFSAVEAIGLTREEDGFLKEFVIKGDRSVKEAGGGLCQIATTLFRLALNGGLPVTARTNHLYVVSYYGPGLDATVYGPKKDLRFINDTGHWLLLQARMEGEEVAMEFYGRRDGRIAAISDPKISKRIPPPKPKYVLSPDLKPGEEKCTEQARFGMNAEVTYQVSYPSGKENIQIFKSAYQPWQKVCLVGLLDQFSVQ